MSRRTSKQLAIIQAAKARLLREYAADLEAAAKSVLFEEMEEGDRSYGMIEGERVATASMSAPEYRPVIADEMAFRDWVAANHPEAIVQAVASWFSATANLKAIIEKTGEVPAGVEFRRGNPTLSVRVPPEQRETILLLAKQGSPLLLGGSDE